jgi:hypothetical protein
VAGHTNFAQWAGSVLDIEPKYVFELLQDAARIRTVSTLRADLVQHLTKASSRKVRADVIATQGVEAAQVIMTEGLVQAEKLGKKRPTAALLSSIAKDLNTPSIPQQEKRSADPLLAAVLTTAPAVVALKRAAAALRERVFTALSRRPPQVRRWKPTVRRPRSAWTPWRPRCSAS